MFRSRGLSLNQALMMALLLFFALVIGGINYIVNKWTEDSFARLQRDNLLQQTGMLFRSINASMENVRFVLDDYARYPAVTRAVMLPKPDLPELARFMDGLSILGEKYQITLLNYRGETIYATRPQPRFDYARLPWVAKLAEGEESHYDEISSDGKSFYFRIAVPVCCNGHSEGILVAEMPVSLWSRRFRNGIIPDNSYMKLVYKHRVIASFGRQAASPYQEVNLGRTGIRVQYHGDFSALERNREVLTVMLSSTLLVLFFLLCLAAFLLIHYGFAKSLSELRSFAHRLAVSHNGAPVPANQKITELRQLAVDFNEMGERIAARETALREAKTSLEQEVAARTAELRHELAEKQRTEAELRRMHEELEDRVRSRTVELEKTNAELQTALRELADTQGALLQTEKMASIGQLAAGIAHEINNPAGFVIGNLQTLAQYVRDLGTAVDAYAAAFPEPGTSPDEIAVRREKLAVVLEKLQLPVIRQDLDALLADATEGMRRITRIVTSLKDFSHHDDQDVEEFDLNRLLDQTLDVAAAELKYKAKVIREYGDIPLVAAYIGQIAQVIMNLLVNAGQAIDKYGEIRLRTWSEGDFVFFSIGDNGCGISPENLMRIFDPFFTTKPVGVGTGLGLNIVYNYVKSNRGEVTVSSDVGVGTVFTVKLPRAAE
ncbi:MAG: ATP-binding protein [Victivallales bacterium]|nr:ATP-binding protein [Victivallales bacterium]